MTTAASLTFEAETHTYRYGSKVVPGVTSVLQPLQMLQGVPWDVLEAAREFGSHVHLACHLWNIEQLDLKALDKALCPYLAGWIAFLDETGFIIRRSETPVHNKKIGYAGTPDVDGDWQRTSWVVDIKSGVVPVTVGPQLAAYQQALDPRPRRRLCVQLTGDGRYKLHEQKDLADFHTFLSALNIYNFLQKRKPAHVDEYA